MGGEAEIHQDAEEKSRTKHHYLISHRTIWSRSDRTYIGSRGGAPKLPPRVLSRTTPRSFRRRRYFSRGSRHVRGIDGGGRRGKTRQM
ncbi:hypothetical protein YC2023_032576 [Brassica napus]